MGFMMAPMGDGTETRANPYEKRGLPLPLPPVEIGQAILSDWDAMGNCAPGPVPLDFAEVRAFAELNRLHPDDALMIRALSEEFCAGFRHGRNPFAKPPWDGDDG